MIRRLLGPLEAHPQNASYYYYYIHGFTWSFDPTPAVVMVTNRSLAQARQANTLAKCDAALLFRYQGGPSSASAFP
jgi:hypothetical protein